MTSKYFLFTVKISDDVQTGKIIFTKDQWFDIVNSKFNIISSEVKTGILYGVESKWLEVVSEK